MATPSQRLSGIGSGFAKFFSPPPPNVIRLTIGEPDMNTPSPIIDATINALLEGKTHYSRTQGLEQTVESIASYLSDNEQIIDSENITVTNGAKQALFTSFLSVGDPGQNVIIPSPCWSSYGPQLKICGLEPVFVPLETNLHLDISEIASAINPATTAIVLNSPNNPTGMVYDEIELQSVVDLAIEHDLWIISDEIYAPMVWAENKKHIPVRTLNGAKQRTLTIGGLSKGWAMTGWRLGWLHCPSNIVEHVKTVQSNTISHAPTFLQYGAVVALEQDNLAQSIVETFRRRQKLIQDRLQNMPLINTPNLEGAFYAFVNIEKTGLDDVVVAERLLEEAQVQVIPGSLIPFGSGWIRISYAASEEILNEAMDRIENWLSKLRPIENN